MRVRYLRGRLELEDLEKIREYTEMDLALMMIKRMKGLYKISREAVKGNKLARIELQKQMNDQINMALIMREMVRVSMGRKIKKKNPVLDTLIERERKTATRDLAMERGLAADAMLERIIRVRLAEEKRKKEREQERKEKRRRAVGGEH